MVNTLTYQMPPKAAPCWYGKGSWVDCAFYKGRLEIIILNEIQLVEK